MNVNFRRLVMAASLIGVAATYQPALAQKKPSAGPYGLAISAEFPFQKKRLSVLESHIAYVDEGTGPVVLFLHGNPTSSYLWRNVLPHVVSAGYRAVAPDLIGMGDSGKPKIGYTFGDHAAYLDAFIMSAELTDLTLVVHDWGSGLGMRYARLNPDNVSAMAFMEAIIPPGMPAPSYEAMGPEFGKLFRSLRTEGVGEEMVLKNNFFVEEILPKMGVARGLTDEEMEHYRAPYPTPESRLPTLQWPREVPIGGEPKEAHDAIVANGKWLVESGIPKLFFYATPGALNPAPVVEWVVANVPNLETRFLGLGAHFLQEDHPDQIGTGIADWLRRIQNQ
jgi:haloalkane dehalogenase